MIPMILDDFTNLINKRLQVRILVKGTPIRQGFLGRSIPNIVSTIGNIG